MLELTTARLRLRQFAAADLNDLARFLANPAVMRHMGLAGETHSRAESEKVLHSIIAHWHRHGFGRWAVAEKDHGQLVGYGGLRAFGQNAELVYLLDEPYWGRGLATEMARACLAFGFTQRPFAQIIALTKPGNLASHRVLEKIGLRYQGRVKFFQLMAAMGMPYLQQPASADFKVIKYAIARVEFQAQQPSG